MSSSAFVSLVIAALIVLLIIVVIGRTIRVIQQGLVGVVKRLGQFQSVRNPGVTFLVPFIDRMEAVDMRETPRTGDRQDVITKDNVSVVVNATIFSQVVDPRLALFSVSNYLLAVDQISRTTLRAIFGEMSLDEALSQREQINTRLQNQMETVTDKWGVRINRVEILDIVSPQDRSRLRSSRPKARSRQPSSTRRGSGKRRSWRQKAALRPSQQSTARSRGERPHPSCLRSFSWTRLASSLPAPTRRSWFRSSRPACWAPRRHCARCWTACRRPILSKSRLNDQIVPSGGTPPEGMAPEERRRPPLRGALFLPGAGSRNELVQGTRRLPASLFGLDPVRVLWPMPQHPPRRLRRGAVPTSWGPYSWRRKLKTATPIMRRPNPSTIAASRPIVTTWLFRVSASLSSTGAGTPVAPSTIRRTGSTPYVSGSRRVSAVIQPGRPVTGNIAPDRKNAGCTRKLRTNWNPIIERMREAIATPTPDSANAMQKIRPITSTTTSGVSFTPKKGASTSRITPWNIACVAPPRILPMATADRSIGATNTSLRKPNSRSQMMDIPLKIEEKSTAIPMIPGYMNTW